MISEEKLTIPKTLNERVENNKNKYVKLNKTNETT